MKRLFIVFLLFVSIMLKGAEPPFQYPEGFRVDNRSDDGRSWRESVTVKGKYSEIKKTLAVNLKRAGYRIKHDIPLSETPPSTLTAWEKGGKILVLMIFESSPEEVCFSWGFFDN